MRIVTALGFATVGTALAGVLTACSFSIGGGFDAEKAETAITDGINEQAGLDATVSCPEDPEWVVGGTFECEATIDTVTEPVTVTMVDDDHNIDWNLDFVDQGEVATTVADDFNTSLGSSATVECDPLSGVGVASGDTMECTLVLPNGDRTTVSIVVGDSLDWDAPGVVDVARAESVIDSGIQEQTGIDGEVDCGEDPLWAGDGTKECELTGEEVQAVIDVTLHDDGNLDWAIQ